MTLFSRRPSLRWLVPAAAVVLLTAGGSVAGVLTANAGSPLPERSAAQLLVDVQNAKVKGLSGTIVQNADLGLPSLPGIGGSGSSDMTSLISGSHTLRLWYAGPNKVRLALLGTLGESDVVRNGADLWTWSSKDKTATHRKVPVAGADTPGSLASASPMTPQQAADAALAAISPSTEVSTDGTATVAGRSAYELVLQPKESGSLIGSVRIAVDSATRVPTRVQVFGRGADKAALEVAFTRFDPTTPDTSAFEFNPPPGTTVTESDSDAAKARAGTDNAAPDHATPDHAAPGHAASDRPTVKGKGWTSVLVAKVPATSTASGSGARSDSGAGSLAQVLTSLPSVSGSWGSGHLLEGTLFSALLTDDGRLVVGAVTKEALFAALAA